MKNIDQTKRDKQAMAATSSTAAGQNRPSRSIFVEVNPMPRKVMPTYEVTKELLQRIELYAAQGCTIHQICHNIGWCLDTLYKKKIKHKELTEAIARGQSKGITIVSNELFKKCKGGDLTAIIFYLKARAKWSDKPEMEVNPPQVNVVNQNITDDQFKRFAEQFKSDITSK